MSTEVGQDRASSTSNASTAPLVTVLFPTYNSERYLRESLDSLVAQTYKNLEIIVIDGGSQDSTLRILEEYRALGKMEILAQGPQEGLAAALNLGLEHAHGKYVCRLDADDLFLPEKVDAQVRFMESTDYVMVHTAAYIINDRGYIISTEWIPSYTDETLLRLLFTTNPIRHPSVMFSKERLNELKYDSEMLYSEDYDFWFRLLGEGRIGFINLPLIKFRLHRLNKSVVDFRVQQTYANTAIGRALSRYRIDSIYPELQLIRSNRNLRAARARCCVDLAEALLKYEQPDWSLTLYKEAYDTYPCAETAGQYGICLYTWRRLELAKQFLLIALQMSPSNIEFNFYLANCLVMLGEPEKSIGLYKNLLEATPEIDQARKNLKIITSRRLPSGTEQRMAELRRAGFRFSLSSTFSKMVLR
jgi:glycosyltransferase involved in cell wall biosynthesis